MLRYERLDTVVYTVEEINKAFELEENPTIFDRVDNIIIKFKNYHYNLGNICYLKVKRKREILSVVLSSLDQCRVEIAKSLLKYLDDLYIDGCSVLVILGKVRRLSIFLGTLDDNNIEFKIEQQSIVNALIYYSNELNHKIKIYDRELKVGLTTATAHNYQKWVLDFCSFMLNIDSKILLHSRYIIKANGHEVVKSTALSDELLTTEFNQYTYIFRRFSSIVLNNESFPLIFDLNNELYWITPIGKVVHKDSDRLKKSPIFNFNKGRNYSLNEITASKHYKHAGHRNHAIKQAKKNKIKANTPYSAARVFIALYACKAYFMHFLFLTGENDSTAASLIFNNNYTIESSETNFKSIKWRANGQTVKYDIQTEFIDDFKIYLRLRSYLLKAYNQSHKELFLHVYKNTLIPAYTSGEVSPWIRKLSSLLFNKNNFIATSKTIRVTKSLWLRNHHGSSLSSYILQHSDKTSSSSYTGSNFESSSEELTHYFSELTNQLLISPGKEISIPSGNCVEPSTPQVVSKTVSTSLLTIDCADQKSCLFCNKYKLHGDEIDIRKLLSIKYLILQSKHLANSIEHFQNVYDLMLARIDDLLSQIKCLGEDQTTLVHEVKQQVFEEEMLSDYWYQKLELLNELGVL